MRRARRFLSGAASLATIAAGAVLLAPGASAAGATLQVDGAGGTDSGDCIAAPCKTIPYALSQAGDGDTVAVAAGTYHVAGPGDQIVINKSLTLQGAGQDKTEIDIATGIGYGFIVTATPDNPNPSVTIKDLAVKGAGDNTTGITVALGTVTVDHVSVTGTSYGINLPYSGTLHVTDSTFSDNILSIYTTHSSEPPVDVSVKGSTLTGGGIVAIDAHTVDISDTTITDATASGDAADVAGYAGVYLETKSEEQHYTATISGSTISGSASNGVYVSGAQTLTIDTSTISGTTAGAGTANPTGFPALGTGVLATQGAELHVSASAITGNAGPGVIAGIASATVNDSTVSGNGGSAVMLINSAATVSDSTLVQTKPWPEGSQISFPSAAIFAPQSGEPGSGSGPVTVTGSIVAGGGDSLACAAAVTDGGYNLATDDTCTWSAAGSVAKTDPQLGALADNGGPTQTQLPADHSAAVDAIPFGKAGCTADATDQRGVSRPQPGPRGRCDIGAVELKQAPLAISPKTLPHATVGTEYHAQLHATGGLDTDYTFALAEGSALPADLTLSKDGLIRGTPKKSGTFSFTVVVGDPVTRTYDLVVDPAAAATSPSSSAGSSTSSSAAASPSSTAGSPAGSGAPLANTGASAGLQLWWAALLLGAGIALLAAGSLRRRGTARRH